MEVKIKCEKMELAADLIQDMAKFMQITELESIADFPDEMAVFAEANAFILKCVLNRLCSEFY